MLRRSLAVLPAGVYAFAKPIASDGGWPGMELSSSGVQRSTEGGIVSVGAKINYQSEKVKVVTSVLSHFSLLVIEILI